MHIMAEKKIICIATGTRAEYGLLKPLILRLMKQDNFEIRLIVTGTHLSPEFGFTYQEILNDGIPVDYKSEIVLASDTESGMVKSTGLAMISFSDYFFNRKPDLLIVLGDRYEILACVTAAALMRIPVAHLHGGEVTYGVVDEFIRHSVTKMSTLHFTSCESYRKRVIQLGEQPGTVYNVGALGVENIFNIQTLSLKDLENDLSFTLNGKNFAVVTFHPITLENYTGAEQLRELMLALDAFPDMKFVITKANSDAGGREINQLWSDYIVNRNNCYLVASLGMRRYLSLTKYAAVIIGNSSSGIIEGPATGTPTVNIGDRQKGRIMADSVICCQPKASDIINAIGKAVTYEFQVLASNVLNPYGDGDTSQKIVKIIQNFFSQERNVQKYFYDIEFN